MDTVIFSASPFQAFLTSFGTIIGLFALSVVGIGWAFLKRDQSRGARTAMGLAAVILALAAVASAGATANTIMNGDRIVTARLNDKNEVTRDCGNDTGSTCVSWKLEMKAGSTLYDFTVPRSAYDKAEVGGCYTVTFYPSAGLFSNPAATDSYQTVSTVTRIEVATAGACP